MCQSVCVVGVCVCGGRVCVCLCVSVCVSISTCVCTLCTVYRFKTMNQSLLQFIVHHYVQ